MEGLGDFRVLVDNPVRNVLDVLLLLLRECCLVGDVDVGLLFSLVGSMLPHVGA